MLYTKGNDIHEAIKNTPSYIEKIIICLNLTNLYGIKKLDHSHLEQLQILYSRETPKLVNACIGVTSWI